MLARGALGNPWLFEQLLGPRSAEPTRAEVLAELDWVIARAVEHLGAERAARYLRKFYPWYVARLGLDRHRPRRCKRPCRRPRASREARRLLDDLRGRRARPRRSPPERLAAARAPSLYCCARCRPPGRELARSASAGSVGFVARRNPRQPRARPRSHMPKDVILTPEGLEKLKDELELLSTERRREVAERIKEAREFGDISENSEYDDAKNEQAMLESRIAQLQEKLRMATVIESKDLSTDVVQVGSVVHVKDEKTGKSVKYTIVGSAEANPEENKLSNESPVGRALLGHKRGDEVAVQVPRGPARKLKITKIDVGLK